MDRAAAEQQFAGLLSQIPPGTDLYTFLEQYLKAQVTPNLGKPFWISAWTALGLMSAFIVLVAIGLVLRYKRKRLHFIIYDGAVTRLDHRLIVPLLWCVQAMQFIALTVQFDDAWSKQEFSPQFGRFWSTIHIPLLCSYALISASVIASAPPVRLWLSRIRYGVWIFNACTFFFILAITGVIIPLAFNVSKKMTASTDVLQRTFAILRKAKAAGDPTQLSALLPIIPEFERTGAESQQAGRRNQVVATIYICFFLLTGFAPAIVLARTVRRKIERLEANSTSAFASHSQSVATTPTGLLPAHSTTAIQLSPYMPSPLSSSGSTANVPKAAESRYVPELPKDRPFAALVAAQTAPLPSRFQNIIDEKGQSGLERAARLRAALKHENMMTAAYCLLLIAFLGCTLFMSVKEKASITPKQDMLLTYSFPVWNFTVPAIIVAIIFVKDAYSIQSYGTKADRNPAFAGLQQPVIVAPMVSQTVDVVYSEERREKSQFDEDDEEKSWRPRYT